jgi:hypothetical protein
VILSHVSNAIAACTKEKESRRKASVAEVATARLLPPAQPKRFAMLLIALATIPCLAGPAPEALSTAHDGSWSVFLYCADTQDKAGLVHGYTYEFPVQIRSGRLEGRYDEKTPPAFVHFAGRVLADGTVHIEADGLSGSPDATIGKVSRGTPYRYTMQGKLQADRGRADRIELRPCTADFTRQASR